MLCFEFAIVLSGQAVQLTCPATTLSTSTRRVNLNTQYGLSGYIRPELALLLLFRWLECVSPGIMKCVHRCGQGPS